jgi:hypothetical protein
MHDDEQGEPVLLEPMSPEELGTVRLVEGFALQGGLGTTLGEDGQPYGMESIVLLHLATRVNGTPRRSSTIVSFDRERFLELMEATVQVANQLYGDDAINALTHGLVQVYGANLPPLPADYGQGRQ